MSFRGDDRAMFGILFMFAMFLLAAIYLVIVGSFIGGFEGTAIVAYDNPDYNTSAEYETGKRVMLVYVPLIIMGSGVFFGAVWYLRRERSGGTRRRPPL